jgi:carbon-monoxide dehydrogenase medium subunit
VIPTAFEYERASTLDDALAKLQAANGAGKLIAGGHSLVPLMKLRLSEPTVLIDIARVPGLADIKEDGDMIEIGALAVHHEVATSPLLRERCPAVCDTAAVIGDPQVRNRGTLGGSLAHADPAADYPAAMLALGAEFHLKGPSGWRVVPATDFFQGVFTVDLREDEILAKVRLAPAPVSSYAKLHQQASRFAIVGVAAALDVSGGIIQRASLGLTGAASCASRLSRVEGALVGQAPSSEVIAAASARAGDGIDDLNEDIHASAEYRRDMVSVFTRRALEGARARLNGRA